MRVQIGAILTTTPVAAFTLWAKSAGRYDHFVDEKLCEALRVCLIGLGWVVLAKQEAEQLVLIPPKLINMVPDLDRCNELLRRAFPVFLVVAGLCFTSRIFSR